MSWQALQMSVVHIDNGVQVQHECINVNLKITNERGGLLFTCANCRMRVLLPDPPSTLAVDASTVPFKWEWEPKP